MGNGTLAISLIGGLGLLSTPLTIQAEIPTNATTLEPSLDVSTINPYTNRVGNYTQFVQFMQGTQTFSFHYDNAQNEITPEEDEYPDIEVIEVPVVKKMVFQFKRPARLEFS